MNAYARRHGKSDCRTAAPRRRREVSTRIVLWAEAAGDGGVGPARIGRTAVGRAAWREASQREPCPAPPISSFEPWKALGQRLFGNLSEDQPQLCGAAAHLAAPGGLRLHRSAHCIGQLQRLPPV